MGPMSSKSGDSVQEDAASADHEQVDRQPSEGCANPLGEERSSSQSLG